MIFITETLIMFHIELKNFSEITHFSVTKPQKLPSAAENTTENTLNRHCRSQRPK